MTRKSLLVSQSLMALQTIARGDMLAPPEGKECLSQAALRPEGQSSPLVPCLLGRVAHGIESQRQLLVQHALQAGLQLQTVTGSKVILEFCLRGDMVHCIGVGHARKPQAGYSTRIKLALVVSTYSVMHLRGRLGETLWSEHAFLEWSLLRELWLCQWWKAAARWWFCHCCAARAILDALHKARQLLSDGSTHCQTCMPHRLLYCRRCLPSRQAVDPMRTECH